MKTFKQLFICVFLLSSVAVHAQNWNNRYSTAVFTQNQITRENRIYSPFVNTLYNFTGALTVFFPQENVYSMAALNGKARPLIVLVHGGGWTGGTKEDFASTAYFYAQLGYVVASIDYRLFNQNQNSSGYNPPSYITQQINIMMNLNNQFKTDKQGLQNNASALPCYIAMQDLNAAIKYLCYHSTNFLIDKNNIFLMGESAGAATVLTYALADVNELEYHFNYGTTANVGPMNYSTQQNCKNQTFTIRGVVSLAGGIQYADYLKYNENIPLLLQHCPDDNIALINGNTSQCAMALGSNQIIQNIKNYNTSGGNYPCSYLYRTHRIFSLDPNEHVFQDAFRLQFNLPITQFLYNIYKNNTNCTPYNFPATYAPYIQTVTSRPSPAMREGLDEVMGIEEQAGISSYPNPAKDAITIKGIEAGSLADVKIYNAQGQLVINKQTESHSGDVSLSVSDLTPGMYIMYIQTDVQSKQLKFVKE
jgi:hypothetical protein